MLLKCEWPHRFLLHHSIANKEVMAENDCGTILLVSGNIAWSRHCTLQLKTVGSPSREMNSFYVRWSCWRLITLRMYALCCLSFSLHLVVPLVGKSLLDGNQEPECAAAGQ